jgi:hypothetical protein
VSSFVPPKPPVSRCDHSFVFLDTSKTTSYGGYNTNYKRIDRFFCSRCLKERSIIKEDCVREAPDWW